MIYGYEDIVFLGILCYLLLLAVQGGLNNY